MTENDTFRLLSRPSYDDLIYMFKCLSDLERRTVLISENTRREFLGKHGWTLEEYQKISYNRWMQDEAWKKDN